MKKLGFIFLLSVAMLFMACKGEKSSSDTKDKKVQKKTVQRSFEKLSLEKVKKIKLHEWPINKDFAMSEKQEC